MALFGKNPEQNEPTPPPSGPPVDLVLKMRGQGYSNNQIVQTLQREGYKSHDIFDAMNQADIKGSVSPTPKGGEMADPENPMQMKPAPEAAPEMAPTTGGQAMPPNMAPPSDMPPSMAPPEMTPMQANSAPYANPMDAGADKENIQEIAETIIEEKWQDLVKDVKKVIDWKERTEAHLAQMGQKFDDLKDNFEQLHKGVIGKIGEYDESLSNVGTEIKALEKVFQKILPTLTENVHELSQITKDMKSKTKVSK